MNEYVQKIYAVHEAFFGTKLEPAAIKMVSKQVKEIGRFLKTGETETILLCIILAEAEGREIAVKDLREYCGLDQAQFKPCIAALQRLVKLDLIEIQGAGLRRRKNFINNPQNCMIHPAPRVKQALEAGNPELLKVGEINSLGKFFQAYEKLNASRKVASYPLSDFLKKVTGLCKRAKALDLIALLDKNKITGVDRILILGSVQQALNGSESFDADDILKELFTGEPDLFFETMNSLKSGKNSVLAKGFLEIYESELLESNAKISVKLGKKMFDVLPQFLKPVTKKPTSTLFKFLNPESIVTVPMYYNQALDRQIQTITKSLGDPNFTQLQQELHKKSLHKGLTIIFHGASGTGKTETVFQIARATGRSIMMVDPAEIKSMWIGESEKNLRTMFQQYRSFSEKSARMPILLFNEADALIQTRRQIKNGTDAHDNALQNLLLQELEEFEGIFIGTTNHLQNIDSAFERRILFKVEFSTPAPEVRTQILRTKFDSFNPGWLQQIGTRYCVTGSQIENVRKKLAIEEVLNQDFTPTLEMLEDLFRNESFIPAAIQAKQPVGFRYSWMTNKKE